MVPTEAARIGLADGTRHGSTWRKLARRDGIQSVSSKRRGLGSVSVTATVPVTALVTALATAPATARSFTRSCELSFEALSLFLAQYTCT